MNTIFEELVSAFDLSSLSIDILQQITTILKQQNDKLLSSFVLQVYHSLVILEHKIWQLLSLNSCEWFNQLDCLEFFQTFALFNKKLIFDQENIQDDMKISLLLPETNDQIDSILQKIKQNNDDNNSFIIITSLWFDNLAFFIHEYTRLSHLPIIIYINQYLGKHFLLSEEFKIYLIQLQQTQISSSIFTAKQRFYMEACPLVLNAYFFSNPTICEFTPEQVFSHIGNEYLQMIQIQSYTVEFWSKNLLACISHLIAFMRAFLWWDGEKGTKIKMLLPTEKILCDYIQAHIHIMDNKPFYKSLMIQRTNDETILIDSVLLVLINIVQALNINWFLRSIKQLPDILLNIAQGSIYFRIYLCSYGILSEILTDEHIKELRISENAKTFFFDMLEQAWQHPLKVFKQIPITYFLKGFANLSKNDFIQQATLKLNKISLFIEMCDQYPVVFDIIWAFSFNPDIQEQLRSSSSFMSKLVHLSKDCDNEKMKKMIDGILWNLEINHEDRPTADSDDNKSFDIMISYSHKDEELCKQIYEQLTKSGYRVWIDFDQMHGNVMDAMAQAIECSQTVIICMSEQYRKSNYCRAEANYAFQRQRKIVPVLLQKHYKPDGWLLFLIGQLLYVNFTKYEFNRAMELLFNELDIEGRTETSVASAQSTDNIDIVPPVISVASSSRVSVPSTVSSNIFEWTQTQVQDWLLENNLVHMSRLLKNCDGRSLVYLSKYMKSCQPQQILNLLQEDSMQRTNQSISLIEISCFHSLMDQIKKQHQSTGTNIVTERKDD